MSRTISTSSTIVIDRPPSSVFEFVTRPHNWVGVHPVTQEVRGTGDGASAKVGTAFTETISADGTPGFDVRWTVCERAEGRSWTITTDALGDPGVSCRIRYEFEPHSEGTMFGRYMTVTYPPDSSATNRYRLPPEAAAEPDVHDRYLAAVKRCLESIEQISQ